MIVVMPYVWGPNLHVADLDRSIAYYTGVLGMKELARFGTATFDKAVVSFGDDIDEASCLALVSQKDRTEPYEMGDAYLRLVLVVDDVASVCRRVVEAGCEVTREPAEAKAVRKIIGMVSDPDGYTVELVQQL